MHTSSHWFDSATCKLIDWGDGTATLVGLHSEKRNEGHATTLMQQMCDYFDNQNITVIADVNPFGKRKDGLTMQQLVKFYEKFGFKVVGNVKTVLMERIPSQ